MKAAGIIFRVFFLCSILAALGCEPKAAPVESPAKGDDTLIVSAYTSYSPVSIKIMPLTEVAPAGRDEGESNINIYVSLLDSFGCEVKSPGIFRFEIYERVLRSSEPKGRRVVIWPGIDLTDAVENNNYWRDFLRAYEFKLDFEPQKNQSYILQVTCLCPSGRRLMDEFVLKP